MDIEVSFNEARVPGLLIAKPTTTNDCYHFVLCVLMPREPQPEGALRSCSVRRCELASLDETARVGQNVSNGEDSLRGKQWGGLPSRKRPRLRYFCCGAANEATFVTPAQISEMRGVPHRFEKRVRGAVICHGRFQETLLALSGAANGDSLLESCR